VPFGHTSPAPFGGTLPKGEGLGVVVLNNHLHECGKDLVCCGAWGRTTVCIFRLNDYRSRKPQFHLVILADSAGITVVFSQVFRIFHKFGRFGCDFSLKN